MPNRESHRPTGTRQVAISFLAGFVGCACAVFLPKLGAFLQVYRQESPAGSAQHLQVLSMEYVLVGCAFSVLAGAALVFYEWGKSRKPWDMFKTAFGLPAAVTAVFAGGVGASDLTTMQQQQKQLEDALAQASGIAISAAPDASKGPGTSLLDPVFATVHASSVTPEPRQLGMLFVGPQYWVVLAGAPSQQEADARRAELRSRLIHPRTKVPVALDVVAYRGRYLVVEAGGGRERSTALIRAAELKRDYGVPVTLQEVPVRK